MNVLFLTIYRINNLSERGIYTDLMRKFRDEGHKVFIVTPSERRYKQKTAFNEQEGISLLKVYTLNFQKTNVIEKGIGTLLIEYQFLDAIKKYLSEIKFDVIIYSTPPITFTRVIKFIKRKSSADSYLLLKDIFPQNAVDLGLMKKNGLIHTFFSSKERSLYAVSDYIGCMSKANLDYLSINNPQINTDKMHVNPNSIEPVNSFLSHDQKVNIRKQYAIPLNNTTFVYGGNIGKPQGIHFLIEVIESNKLNDKCFFVVVGDGTEFNRLNSWFKMNKPVNAILLSGLPKQEYDNLVQSCDVGMIFLDKRFTIPNYPSRLLSYLEYKMPVITGTDGTTDIGKDAEENGYGFYCESGNLKLMNSQITFLSKNPDVIQMMGNKGYNYLLKNFSVENSYAIIMNQLKTN